MGFILLALIAVVIISQIAGQNICNGIKDSDASDPPKYCDITAFTSEYYEGKNLQDVAIKYNDVGYRNLYGGDIILPIRDSDCSLVVESDEATNSIVSSQIHNDFHVIDSSIYRNACYCNAQSVGASGVCQTTQQIGNFINNEVIETAAENDKTTLNIIRVMAPAGYKISSVQAGKVIITAINELKGNTPIGVTYQVFDTYSCSLNDLGKRVFDYSLVGTRLTTEMKKGVFYHGSDQALINLNEDFKNLKNFDPAGMSWNQITAAAFSGDKCQFNPTEPRYVTELDSATNSIQNARVKGESNAAKFIAYITPKRIDATLASIDAKQYFQDYNSVNILIVAVFRLNRLPEFVGAVWTYFDAKHDFERGLYFSSNKKFVSAVGQYSRWKQTNLIELVFNAIIWSLISTVVILVALFKLQIIQFHRD